MIKFKNKNEATSNEISFVPHLSETKDVIDRPRAGAAANNDDELTTVIIDTGNKFAYDTINNNEELVFASNNESNLGSNNSKQRQRKTNSTNEVAEPSSPDPSTNIVNENNVKQQERAFDISNTHGLLEGSSKEHIGHKSADDVDTKSKSNSQSNRKISAKSEKSEISAGTNATTSTEKPPNDYEIKRFISEHIKYKSNNVTIKKSWGKWSPWSSCSRSCDEGVMQQSRECMEKT